MAEELAVLGERLLLGEARRRQLGVVAAERQVAEAVDMGLVLLCRPLAVAAGEGP